MSYYVIIQYCHDLARHEHVNVGVFIWDPERHFAGSLLDEALQAVPDSVDKDRLLVFLRGLATSLQRESQQWKNVAALDRHSRSMGNHLLLTPPRVVLCHESPQDTLQGLFEALVSKP